ncbi:MAG: pyruvate kinase, partial [Steroidobacteraceae bacterium]
MNMPGRPASPSPRTPPRTKIVCTLGPATDAADVLDALVAAGMSVARIN